MRAAKGGAVGRIGGREGGTILEGRETYASAGGHGNSDAPYHNHRWQIESCRNGCLVRFCFCDRAENPLRLGVA